MQAFTESIREIIGPVVERAVAIAVVSTRDLVSKDFVMEINETKMRKAAHMMAQNLAASLAMVTSKEPLRLSIVANLRTIFIAHGLNDVSQIFGALCILKKKVLNHVCYRALQNKPLS